MCYAVTGDGMTVYMDEVWLLNSVVDYLLLWVSGGLLGVPMRRRRVLAAGAAGGIYAALSLLPGFTFLGSGAARVLAAAGLCLAAFGEKRGLLRQTVVLFLLAAAFSGITLLLTEVFSAPGALIGGTVYYPLSLGVLILTAGGACAVMSWGLCRLTRHGGETAQGEVTIGGRAAAFTALYDTGNTLHDPISGWPVMVMDWTVLATLWPELGLEEQSFQQPEGLVTRLREWLPGASPRLIPYKAIGTQRGMLLAVRPDSITISGKVERLLIAFSPVTVSDGGGYQALLGGKR